MVFSINELGIDTMANMLYECVETDETSGLILMSTRRELIDFSGEIVEQHLSAGIDGVERIVQDVNEGICELFFSNGSQITILSEEDRARGRRFQYVLYSDRLPAERIGALHGLVRQKSDTYNKKSDTVPKKKITSFAKSKELDEFLKQFNVI